MREKFDALLFKKRFKPSKLKASVKLAISRLAVLKNQRQARCSVARSDVVELLNLGNNDRALFRVEQVIKEQNMLDVYDSLEGYCHLLLERIDLIEQEKVCPEELKEAISSLIYATTRCGEFPELQEIRAILASRFGKEFAARAAELRNHCGVNVKIIQKLSTRMPNMENKVKVLKEIASDNNIVLQMEETVAPTAVDSQKENQQKPIQVQDKEREEDFSDSVKLRRKYRDVADAAQAAFESAEYAAAAARAAVELSRSGSTDPDDPSSPNLRSRKAFATFEPKESKLQTREEKDRLEAEHTKIEMKSEKIDPIIEQFRQNANGIEFKRSLSASSMDSEDKNLNEMKMSSDEEGQIKPLAREAVFDESDGEDQMNAINDLDGYRKNDNVEERSRKLNNSVSQAEFGKELGPGNSPARFTADDSTQVEPLNINRRPISVRSKWTRGF
ncbi:hypothetical protein BUALT_Bualt17G0096200 [Buddleja alternifolia]|uniref:Uncharacterized protein n=1 Tax=Buddleja alternifolia TaxID=168488 RepID=A0AAV6WHZ4_9LAMI|nr:hypothetical protein BUALT_Bualt17G0096200 [Buddleja alternifolia]